MIIKKNIKKVLIKIIKNKYLTYFVAIFTLFFINETLNNSDTLNIFNLIMSNKVIKLVLFLMILTIGYFNLGLGLLLFINLYFVINIKKNIENFSNIFPNLIDKNEVLKYKKYIKNDVDREVKKKEDKKEKKTEVIDKVEEEESDNKSKIMMNSDLRKKKLLEELKEIEKHEEKEKNETIESDLDDKYNTTKKNLELLESNRSEDNEDEEISSTDSSSSNVSSSDSSSTDSEKEYNNVSMKKARKHVLGKIRNKIKKKYVKDE